MVVERLTSLPNGISGLHILFSNAMISMKMNDGPRGIFGVGRGLRQADPRSPFLYVTVDDVPTRGLSG